MSNSEYYIVKKVSIFYGPAGGGHYTVSKALEEEYKERGLEVKLFDITSFGKQGFKNPSKSYSFFIKYLRIPHMLVNYSMRIPLIAKLFNRLIWQQTKEQLIPFMKELCTENELIINTYPQYTYILNESLKQIGSKVALVNIVTDISFIYSLWFDKRSTLTILPTIEAYQNGYPFFKNFKLKVIKLGIPLRSKFHLTEKKSKKIKENKGDIKDITTKQILVLGGAEGMGNIIKLVDIIDKNCNDLKILIAVGKDLKLKEKINSKTYLNKVEVIEWTDKFEQYIKESNIIITKGGSITLWECMSTNNQIIIFDYIKGQETGNKEIAKNYSNAIYEPNFKKIVTIINKNCFNTKHSSLASINWTKRIVEKTLSLPIAQIHNSEVKEK
ncbi:MAG: glycosyltransferase [bacterium]